MWFSFRYPGVGEKLKLNVDGLPLRVPGWRGGETTSPSMGHVASQPRPRAYRRSGAKEEVTQLWTLLGCANVKVERRRCGRGRGEEEGAAWLDIIYGVTYDRTRPDLTWFDLTWPDPIRQKEDGQYVLDCHDLWPGSTRPGHANPPGASQPRGRLRYPGWSTSAYTTTTFYVSLYPNISIELS